MNSGHPDVASARIGSGINGRALKRSDFQLHHYLYPQRFFPSKPRPLRLIQSEPAVTAYENVTYTPTTRWAEPYDGSLFDASGARIHDASLWRGTADHCLSREPAPAAGRAQEVEGYDEPLLYLGFISAHYGHFLLETMAKWWALANHRQGAVRCLVHIADPRILQLPFVRAGLELAGIERGQIVAFDTPVRLKRVIVPQSSFQARSHIYTAFKGLWDELPAAAGSGKSNSNQQPLYVSRTRLTRGVAVYLGEKEIEAYMEQKGVPVIHPQELPFAEQMRLFNEHEHIIGIAGSAMHNLIFCRAPKSAVYLTPHRIHANYLLIDACWGTKSTYLQACRMSALPQTFLRQLQARIRPNSKAGIFAQVPIHRLDARRVIAWFEQSGLF